MLKQAFLILLLSSFAAFSYSYFFEKGIFAKPELSRTKNIVPAPEMVPLDSVKLYYQQHMGIFIDARHDFDFRQGHLPHAINIPLSEYEKYLSLLQNFPRDTLIVTYCDGAGCNSSVRLAALFAERGFSNVKIFYGGWNIWRGQNLPVEHE